MASLRPLRQAEPAPQCGQRNEQSKGPDESRPQPVLDWSLTLRSVETRLRDAGIATSGFVRRRALAPDRVSLADAA